MSFVESLYVGLFLLAIVFAVLLGLYLCIRLFSLLFTAMSKRKSVKDSTSQK